jgi:hypothetical protein
LARYGTAWTITNIPLLTDVRCSSEVIYVKKFNIGPENGGRFTYTGVPYSEVFVGSGLTAYNFQAFWK